MLSNTAAAAGLHILRLTPESGSLAETSPGQFVNILPPASSGTLLRRPISICNADTAANELTLMVKRAGKGTDAICDCRENDILDIIYPLGNGFRIPEKKSDVLLAGGGVGIAPLLYLARRLSESGHNVEVLQSARSRSGVQLADEFKQYGDLHITTEDGSEGVKGMADSHPCITRKYDMTYICGPTPMMRNLGGIFASRGIPCQVSLENKMACGIGACLCCVQKDSQDHNVCACTSGPVFNFNDIKL